MQYTNPLISIIIRTYNEEKKIKQCLEKVFSQKIDNPFEVIIIDSQSSDKTLDLVSNFPVKIISIAKKDFTFGRALNIGCSNAKGEYLVFLSAHAIPVSDAWLSYLIADLSLPGVVGVYGKHLADKDCNVLSAIRIERHFRRLELDQKTGKNNKFFCNTNTAITKKIWKTNQFNEEALMSEDQEWGRKILELGYKLNYNERASAYHYHNENLRQIYHRYYCEIYSMLLIENKIIKINFLLNIPYTLTFDTLSILSNKHNLTLLFRLFTDQLIWFVAVIVASMVRLKVFFLGKKNL